MTDIVKRLRKFPGRLPQDAADEIERLRTEYDERHAENNDLFKRAVTAEAETKRLGEQFKWMETNRNYWMDGAFERGIEIKRLRALLAQYHAETEAQKNAS